MKSSISQLAKRRYSCRKYLDRLLSGPERQALEDILAALDRGPLGNRGRFALLAATQSDRDALKGLGTYGFIRGTVGFIVGAGQPGAGDLEDYGYLLEQVVLAATDLDLGTCWLGGTFTKSSFASRFGLEQDEIMPAVIAVGYASENSRSHWLRRGAGSEHRLSPERLFFEGRPTRPLDVDRDPDLAEVLEVVRWAPSASNKQPWRLIHDGRAWHFYLERTKGYGKGAISGLINKADLQRVDMGIAMCHFELAAVERDLSGHWLVHQPPPGGAPDWEYTATWVPHP